MEMNIENVKDLKINTTLSQTIQKEYEKLRDAISRVPVDTRMQKIMDSTGGMVSIADIVAYQIGWGLLLIGWYEAGLNGKMPEMPGEGFLTWDYTGLARHFYSKYQYDSSLEQYRIFHEVVQQIIVIVEHEYRTGNLDKTGVWQWCTLASGKEWPLSKWITVNTSAPYKRATALVRSILK